MYIPFISDNASFRAKNFSSFPYAASTFCACLIFSFILALQTDTLYWSLVLVPPQVEVFVLRHWLQRGHIFYRLQSGNSLKLFLDPIWTHDILSHFSIAQHMALPAYHRYIRQFFTIKYFQTKFTKLDSKSNSSQCSMDVTCLLTKVTSPYSLQA